MTWLKLNFINYDVNTINSTGFYISYKDKCIKDLDHNLMINVPFLIDGNYDLYKVELELKKSNLIIFIYCNFMKLNKLIENNENIPKRNELFEILKNNIENFKYNENIFNYQLKKIFHENYCSNLEKFKNNLYNKTIIKTVNDNELEIDKLHINLDKQELIINKDKELSICSSYIIFDINNNYNLLYNLIEYFCKCKILLVINDEKIKNLVFNRDSLYINLKNFKKILLKDIINSKFIIIDTNLIKNRNYFKNYTKYHSSVEYKKGYLNYLTHINNIILSNKLENIYFYNVELIKFDNIIFLDILNSDILSNSNFKFLTNIIKSNNKIFLQTKWNFNFNYSYYIKHKSILFCEVNYLNDIAYNKNFINNNIYFYLEGENINQIYNSKIIRIKIDKSNVELIDNSLKLYIDIYLYEKILNKKNINYEICINNDVSKNKCPITYENLSSNIRVKCECNHEFLLYGFINHLNYSSKCPICTNNLIDTNIVLFISKKNIINLICNKNLYKAIEVGKDYFNYILINNKVDCEILNERIDKLNYLTKKKINIKYTILENLDKICMNNSYKYININIIDILDTFDKYRTLKCVNNLLNLDNFVINIIKYK